MASDKTGVVVVEGLPVENDELKKEIKEELKEELRDEIRRELREEALRDERREKFEQRRNEQRDFPREIDIDPALAGNQEDCWDSFLDATFMLLGIVVILGPVAILLYFLYDLMAATDPARFFDPVPDCLVLNVTKEFVNKSSGCADIFSYEFTPDQFASVVEVFAQSEEFARADASLCSDPDAVGLDAGRFDIGNQKQCFVLVSFFEGYAPSFSCATPSPPCYSLLSVTSTHDPTVAIVLFATPLCLVFLIYLCCLADQNEYAH